ncbi:cytochrome P450 [Mycena floridula]|nr:cytochrome P450 [Mycena floridula]
MVLSSTDLTVFAAVSSLFLLIRYVRAKREPVKKLPIAPSGEASWIWGHEYSIWETQVNRKYMEWTAELGPVYRIKAAFFQRDVIVAGDNASSNHILQNAYKYEKAPAFLPLTTKLLGRGVVWAHGEEHKRQRRLITPAFTVAAIKGMEPDVLVCAETLSTRLKARIMSQGSEVVVNIEPEVASCTLDIVGRVGFGHDFGSGESSDAKAISDAWHKDVMLGRTFTGFLAPVLLGACPWINNLPIPALQMEGVTKQIALKLASKMLADNRAADTHGGKDILSILMRDNIKRQGNEEVLEDWQLLENISTFIMVGHETTSCSVIFTLLELARHQDVQNKLREEILALHEITVESVLKLEYLDAVTKEGLRMHPASPRTDRIAIVDDILPLTQPIQAADGRTITEIPIKAGQIFHIPTSILNANPEIWGPDAHLFKPERYLDPKNLPSTDRLPHGPYGNSATFIDGQRVCIGWRLAVMEFKVIIALLIRDIVFETTDSEIEEYISGTVQAFSEGKGANMPLRMKLAHPHA